MLGVIVDIVVDGEVVRTETSNRSLLSQIERERKRDSK